MADFVHLHCHSQYSLRDGVATVKELVHAAKDADMPAIALTDHGNLFGLIPFYRECRNAEIKPIIGVEAYVAIFNRQVKTTKIECTHRPLEPGQKFPIERHHLTLLAQNETGYRNLVQLVTRGYTEGFYRKPRIDKQLLREHSEGLIGMSACKAGEVGYFLDRGNKQGALQAIREYREIFGGRFFMELMPHSGYNHQLVEVAEESGTELVITQDVHYIQPEDEEIQKVIGFYGKKTGDRPDYSFDLSFKTREQLEDVFRDYPAGAIQKALDNTLEIADRCNVSLPFLETAKKDSFFYPRFHGLTSQNIEDEQAEASTLLRSRVMGKVKEWGVEEDPQRMNRINHELDVICEANFASYFLAESDILENVGGDEPIFCNARGSAAGSYVAYVLGITQVDPIEHGLLFERFLNPERPKPPDIDIDVEEERREEIFNYITEKYGENNVARLSSFSTVQPRLALNLAGKYLGMPEALVDEAYLLMVDQLKLVADEGVAQGAQIAECIERMPDLKAKMQTDEEIGRLVNLATRVEGKLFNISLHPAGILTSRYPLTDFVPLWMRKNEAAVQIDYNDSELIGLKYDFLLSKALTVIRETFEEIERIHGRKLDIDMPTDDRETYELIGTGNTTTIFQLNSELGRRVSARVKPSDFEELTVLNAMLRPAPIRDGKVDDYIEKRARGGFEHYIKECVPILEETSGVLFLQEQIMSICFNVAGFNWAQADTMRSLLGKKKPKEDDKKELETLKSKFIEGVLKKGYSEDRANELLDELTGFSKYCFNKSHCVSYARLIYVTAYLKRHYPEIYMCSWLNHANTRDNRIEYLNECKRLGIPLLPPDINQSRERFTLQARGDRIDGIRFGLAFVKDVSRRAKAIVAERDENGNYQSLQDFIARASAIKTERGSRMINSRHIEALVKAGAFDSFNKDRNTLLRYCKFGSLTRRRNETRKILKDTAHNIRLSRGFSENDRDALISFLSMPAGEFTVFHKTGYEIEYLGTYLPADLAECIESGEDYLCLPPIEKILNSPDGTLFRVLGFVEEIGPEKRNRYNRTQIPLVLTDPSGKLKLNLDKFKFRPLLLNIAVGNIVSVLASTKVTGLRGERFRIFYPKRIEILG